MSLPYQEYHCKNKECHKLLFKGFVIEGDVEIKCKRCHEITLVRKTEMDEYLCAIKNCPNKIPLRDRVKSG